VVDLYASGLTVIATICLEFKLEIGEFYPSELIPVQEGYY